MSTFSFYGDLFVLFFGNEFGSLLCAVVNETDCKVTASEDTCDGDLISGPLKLPPIAKALDNCPWCFQRVVPVGRYHQRAPEGLLRSL